MNEDLAHSAKAACEGLAIRSRSVADFFFVHAGEGNDELAAHNLDVAHVDQRAQVGGTSWAPLQTLGVDVAQCPSKPNSPAPPNPFWVRSPLRLPHPLKCMVVPVLHLDPMRRPPSPIRPVRPFRHQSVKAHVAGSAEEVGPYRASLERVHEDAVRPAAQKPIEARLAL